MAWHQVEYYGLIHYGLNTYIEVDWGYGDTSPELFNPRNLDTDQWVKAAKDAGMRGLILVAKHHDGFCLWQTKTTDYSLKAAPWREGKGDLVADFMASCKKYGIKPGIYISPWDRNHGDYGTEAYVTDYHEQWRELLTLYGADIFEVWFDGANGGDGYYGGARETRTIPADYYQYDKLFEMLDEYAPNATIFGGYNENALRWVGNESGYAGETNWSTYSKGSAFVANSELKAREVGIKGGQYWLPAEADTPLLQPHRWFYHSQRKPRGLENFVDMYYKTVGRNASLSLGLSPAPDGLIPQADVVAMIAAKKQLDKDFETDLVQESTISSSQFSGDEAALKDSDLFSYWATEEGVNSVSLEIAFTKPTAFNRLMVQEAISLGQRVTSFALEIDINGSWKEVANATTIGYKRILQFKTVTTEKVRLTLNTDAPALTLAKVALFNAPEVLIPPTISRNAFGKVRIKGKSLEYKLHYAIGGNEFKPYTLPVNFQGSGELRAMACHIPSGTQTDIVAKNFTEVARKYRLLSTLTHQSLSTNFKKALDGREETHWVSKPLAGGEEPLITLDIGTKKFINGFSYTPRQDNSREGTFTHYEFFTSKDNQNWTLSNSGAFDNIINNPVAQTVLLETTVKARYVKLVAKKRNGSVASCAEFGLFTSNP